MPSVHRIPAVILSQTHAVMLKKKKINGVEG